MSRRGARTQVPASIAAGEVLLVRFQGGALKLSTRVGILAALLALGLGLLSTEDRARRVIAAAVALIGWCLADRLRRTWGQAVLRKPHAVVAAAAACAVPFGIDGHAQSNVFLALSPLAGVAAVACRGAAVPAFIAVWVAAYVAGAVLGGRGWDVVAAGRHPYDVAYQVTAMLAVSGAAVYVAHVLRRFTREVWTRRATAGQARPRLTPGEVEVLRLRVAGRSRREIHEELPLSEEAVRDRLESATRKLGAVNELQAIRRWVAEGSPER